MFNKSCISHRAESKSLITWKNLNTFCFLRSYFLPLFLTLLPLLANAFCDGTLENILTPFFSRVSLKETSLCLSDVRLFWFTRKYLCTCNKTRTFLVRTQDYSRCSTGCACREYMNTPASVIFDHAHLLVLSEAQKEAAAENRSLRLVLLSILNTAKQEVHRVCCIESVAIHT